MSNHNPLTDNPILLKVAKEINEILKRENVAGAITLHVPGYMHFHVHLEPTYSICKFDGEMLLIKSKLEDFNGDLQAQKKAVKDTANMLHLLFIGTGETCMNLQAASQMLDKQTNAIHYPTNK